ncbi:GNAT family acetyltransferase [Paraoerskovia sediminicola]|uniref:GNAT family acetyltransferase n=1 Tax=Paraoerskovia sediminicola TaxID=1138587 RepID=A0ABM8FZF6_9CELL|nr:GNAT family acetyltransferase [Paraoerskovia sediminicola]BDZ41138.1 GNAT family acetyltransferase [Paraoerskovia sediminicola]
MTVPVELTDVAITDIEDSDVEQVVSLWRECGLVRPWNDPYTDIAQARSGPTSAVIVARSGGAVVASAMLGVDGHRGWVYYVAVHESLRGHGLGGRTVAAAEQRLRRLGARKVQLMVRRSNAAVVGFYERLGYEDQDTAVLGRWLGDGDDARTLDRSVTS